MTALAAESKSCFLDVEQSVAGRAWQLRPVEDRTALAIAQQLGVPEIVGRVVAGRGIGLEDADRYLNPSLKADLPDPYVMVDMDVACMRTASAVMTGEKVAVFGDYDVDGATSSALLFRFFKAAGIVSDLYIPDRIKEGYGPNLPALLHLKKRGASLVITVDCGTMAHGVLEKASAAGLDIIVLDHHQAEPALPGVTALVNPNRLDDTSGLGQLAAVGVTFLFAVGVNRALRAAGWYTKSGRAEPNLMSLLDLVALGTICDVVPLTGVNRALVAQGLKVMARRSNSGIAALGNVARLGEPPGTYHAGFLLGPRVNAGGRVGRASLGIDLLTTDDPDKARQYAKELDGYNRERQAIEMAVEDDALGLLATVDTSSAACIFAAGEGWHPGVIGIVAGRLKEKYGKPAFVIGIDEEIGKGSGRSIPGVNLGAAVTAARQAGLLRNGGGHSMAAGLTVEAGKLDELQVFLNKRLAHSVETARATATLKLDGALSASAAKPELVDLLAQAGPYGQGNPLPRFAFTNLGLVKADVVGANHVRCIFAGAEGGRLKGIAFRALGEPLGDALLSAKGRRLHVAGSLRNNLWMNETSAQLFIDDAAFV